MCIRDSTRSVLIKNTGSGNITIEKAHAACLDMVYGDYDVSRFYGKHAMERNLERTHLGQVSKFIRFLKKQC